MSVRKPCGRISPSAVRSVSAAWSTAYGVVCCNRSRTPGRRLGEPAGHERAQHGGGVVGGDDRELAVDRGRVELGVTSNTRRTPASAGRGERGELSGERGQLVAVADPVEQRVAEVPAQPGQGGADRGLADPELPRRCG